MILATPDPISAPNAIPMPTRGTRQNFAPAGSRWVSSFALDLIGVFCVFFIYGGSTVPGVNEPHYWTKALHFWNPQFGAGDLFLDSGDAHWLFFATLGALTRWFSLPIAVWIGRIVCWGFLAFSWTHLARSVFRIPDSKPLAMIATVWASAWLVGMHWGHWAGEWVIGGCEAKGLAYGFVFLGLSLACRDRWTLAWLMVGGAGAFHVVTGVWVALSLALADLILQWHSGFSWLAWIKKHAAGWVLCAALLVVGAVPALRIDWGVPSSVAVESAMKQVYTRLGHHLSPTHFSEQRWQGFGYQFAIGLVVLAILNRLSVQASRRRLMASPLEFESQELSIGFRLILRVALVALAIATIGLLVDLVLSPYLPNIAAKILRFYWFRWNDVTLPMAISALVVAVGYGILLQGIPQRWPKNLAIASLAISGVLLLVSRFYENVTEQIPAGDRAHLIARTDPPELQLQHYHDWVRACTWIDENSPLEGLWLTPRKQQSFKWHAKRSELACWKDVPQNALSLVEWSTRTSEAYRFNEDKILMPFTTERLWELQRKYGLRYVLLDRRVEGQTPPLLPMIYPSPLEPNETFAVFEFPTPTTNSGAKP